MNVPEPHTSTSDATSPATASPARAMQVSEEELSRARSVEALQVAQEFAPRLPAPVAAEPDARSGLHVVATLIQLGGMTLIAYLCLFNFSIVRGSSMAPRIHDGDRILIDHVSYLFDAVQSGDIVVLKYPLDPSVDYIKRVIGLPGDEVVLEGGRVWVNGDEVLEPYVNAPDPLTRMTVQVKAAHFFVLGDNRQRSCDSREFGLVPQDYVRGKVEMCVWPFDRIGLIDA